MSNWNIKKTIYLVLGFLVVAAIVFFVFFYQSKITFTLTPTDAQIQINNKTYTNQQVIKLNPGKYEVKITANGYIDYQKELKFNIGQVSKITVTLTQTPELKKITTEKVSFPAIDNTKKLIFYLGNSGKTIYQIAKVDQKTPEITAVTPDVFSGLTNLVFSPDCLLAILKKDKQALMYDFKRYDLIHQEVHDWGTGYGSMIWSPDGLKVVYYYAPDNGETTLARANSDQTGQERIYNFKDTSIRNPVLKYSPDGKKIIVLADKLYLFDVYSKSLSNITTPSSVSDANFTLDSTKIIYESNGNLSLIDFESNNNQDLGIKTSLNKTVWFDNDNLIYAQNQSNGNDLFYKYTLSNKNQVQYFYKSNDIIQATNLMLVSNNQRVYFTSNGFVYAMDLASNNY